MDGTPRFDKNNALIQSHVGKLAQEQADVIGKLGSSIETIYSYRYSLNGFAARMTTAQANKLEHMDEVLRVWPDEVRSLVTNHSATFLDLFNADTGLRGPAGLKGEDVIIGVIDSGIAPEHPQLQETRPVDRPSACWSIWAEASLLGRWLCKNYTRAEDIVDYEPPENWNGVCEIGDEFTEENCNNKMIGARTFVDGARATGPIDSGEIFSARDVDGHGTHIATTAAGARTRMLSPRPPASSRQTVVFGSSLNRDASVAPAEPPPTMT